MEQSKACELYHIAGAPAPQGQSGLTKAIIELCVLLGSENNVIVQQEGNASDLPATDGWVVVTDLEGTDVVWYNGSRMATIESSARAGWFAYATLNDGRRLYSEGSNHHWESTPWRQV